MGNALNIQSWSTTAASNDGADSTIGTVANTSSPTSVDDWVRGVMAAIAKYADDTGGALVAGGTSAALTVTTGQSLSSAHIANGLRLCVRTASAATGAATIAVDGLTAVDIKTNGVAAVASGDWASGAILDLVYSSTATAFIAENIGPATGFSITTLSALTAPDHAADYLPIYDASATSNLKILPRYLAPSVRASFSAHKNGSNQAVATSANTKVTFGTEVYDVGSAFASSTWTPPAGTVLITATVSVSGTLADGTVLIVNLYKNGALYKIAATVAGTGGTACTTLCVQDQCTGSDTYEIYVAGDSSYTISGTASETYFMGCMV